MAVAPPDKKASTPRRKLYRLHTWVGFHLAWVMSLVLFTGTFAVVSHEIDWLIRNEMRVAPPDEPAAIDWAAVEAAARSYNLGDTILSLGKMPGDYFAFRARMVNRHGQHYFLHVNPYTGEVTGETSVLTVQRVFRDLHRYLFMPNFLGLPLVSSLAFVLAISLYTGLKTTRKWAQAATRIRLHKSARVVTGDYHRAAGIWSIWFFVVIVVTGGWYMVEFGAAVSGHRIAYAAPQIEETADWGDSRTVELTDAGTLIASATAAFPELRPNLIFYPRRLGGAVKVQGRSPDWLVRDRANGVYLDPTDGRVLEVQRSTESPWPRYLNDLADPLHFGNFGGLTTKLIWFLFGAVMTSLSFTGVWLTWKRLKSAGPSGAQIATTPVLIASALFGFAWYDRLMGPDVPEDELQLAKQVANGHTHELAVTLDENGLPTGQVRLWVTADNGAPNIASVSLACDGRDAGEPVPVRGLAHRVHVRAHVSACSNVAEARTLDLELRYRNGEHPELTWRLTEAIVDRGDWKDETRTSRL